MVCPRIKYGIPEDGGYEYAIDSGREIFQALPDCVKVYVTNVALEKTKLKPICGTVADQTTQKFVLESFNLNWRDRVQPNWYAKDGVDSSLPNGYVITRIHQCGDVPAIIYIYTDGRMSVSTLGNIEDVNIDSANELKQKILNKLGSIASNDDYQDLDIIINDLGTNLNPTDWQGLRFTYELFGRRENGQDGKDENYRINFNWRNGRGEERLGKRVYDDTPNPQPLPDLIDDLLAQN